MEKELERMQQQVYTLMARIAAMEAINHATFSLVCSTGHSPQMREKLLTDIFPSILKIEKTREWDASPEVNAQLKALTRRDLEMAFTSMVSQIDGLQTANNQKIN